MSDTTLAALLVVGAYLLGSIPFGLLLGRARGVDVRNVGSGNIGATNVARNLGKKLGILVLGLDAIKGALPVLLLRWLQLDVVHPFALFACGVAAIVGHCFSVWLGFRGGKGVATSLGVFLAVDPVLVGLATIIFVLVYVAFRIVSLGSMIASASFTVLLWLFDRPRASIALGVIGTLIIIVKHRQNIRRLLRRQEYKV